MEQGEVQLVAGTEYLVFCQLSANSLVICVDAHLRGTAACESIAQPLGHMRQGKRALCGRIWPRCKDVGDNAPGREMVYPGVSRPN